MSPRSFLDELTWRELRFQHTDGLAEHLAAGPTAGYCGFDPTAPSLHVGNLVPVMGLVHLQRAGHRPVALVGGATGMVGDPSGKSAERTLQTLDVVEANARAIGEQLRRFLDFDGALGARMVDNIEWLGDMSLLPFLRDVGKHFSVNVMLGRDSVKSRLETGISYTEFSYMLLQAYDFLELHRRHGVTVQVGGSDQWGNMVAGLELIRRADGGDAHVATFPLVTTASGKKFGKSEAGAISLDPSRTSPYRFYQYWIGADDRDVTRFLRYFTLLGQDEVAQLAEAVETAPGEREAQRALAAEVTTRVHGADALRSAEAITRVLFAKGDPATLDEATLRTMHPEVPFAAVEPPADESGLDTIDLLVATGLVASRGAAKQVIKQGGVAVNGARVSLGERFVPRDRWLAGGHVLVKKGGRDWGLVLVRE